MEIFHIKHGRSIYETKFKQNVLFTDTGNYGNLSLQLITETIQTVMNQYTGVAKMVEDPNFLSKKGLLSHHNLAKT